MAYSCAVLGASGYTAAELLRLLPGHPALTVGAVFGSKSAGARLDTVMPHLAGTTDAVVEDLHGAEVHADVCFSCLPQGVLPEVIDAVDAGVVVDLGDSYRTHPDWVYGLVEVNRAAISNASRIANPGCYPTAALLCLLPFVRAGAVGGPVVIDAMSGVSGAGRVAEDRLLFANLSGSLGAYGTTDHRHRSEIERGLATFGGVDATVSFTPHLAPVPRGLLVTARAPLERDLGDAEVLGILRDAYAAEPFVSVLDDWPATKPVCGSNGAHISARVDGRAGMLICSAAIDNLGKGAASQAVQNANLALGFDEAAGLDPLGVWP